METFKTKVQPLGRCGKRESVPNILDNKKIISIGIKQMSQDLSRETKNKWKEKLSMPASLGRVREIESKFILWPS